MLHPALIQLVLTTVMLCGLALPASGQDHWPQWRGTDGNGVSAAKDLPAVWSASQNIAWRSELPGPASSTPVVWGSRLFLTTPDGADLKLQAYAVESGQLEWESVVSQGSRKFRGDESNLASPSPVTDGRFVVALFGNGQLGCFTKDGEPVWSFNLQDRYGRLSIKFGYSSTPCLWRDRLYLQMVHGDGDPDTHEAKVVCVDLLSGEEQWVSPRITQARQESEQAYSSPVVWTDGSQGELITHGADSVVAYDLANGAELWRLGGINPPGTYHPTFRFVATPAIGDDLLIVPTAKKGPVLAVRPGGRGDVTGTDAVAWSRRRGTPDVPSPLIHNGLVYLCGENGNLTCLDAGDGEILYQERTVRDRHRASPVLADGKLYLTSRGGVVSVVRAGRQFELLAKNDLGEPIAASPVITGKTIYLRTFAALYAIRK